MMIDKTRVKLSQDKKRLENHAKFWQGLRLVSADGGETYHIC